MKSPLKVALYLALVLGSAGLFYQDGVVVRQASAQTQRSAVAPAAFDGVIRSNADRMMREGQGTFRFDTFGSEAFWGDAVQLHRAIAGAKNGGVGEGVSPKTALSVGLKVDSDALPVALKQQIKDGKVDLGDPATTLALLKLNAVLGVKASSTRPAT